MRAHHHIRDQRRRQSAHNDDDEKRRGEEDREKTYSIQLFARKLVDLIDVHGETIDDGAGYGFDTGLNHSVPY